MKKIRNWIVKAKWLSAALFAAVLIMNAARPDPAILAAECAGESSKNCGTGQVSQEGAAFGQSSAAGKEEVAAFGQSSAAGKEEVAAFGQSGRAGKEENAAAGQSGRAGKEENAAAGQSGRAGKEENAAAGQSGRVVKEEKAAAGQSGTAGKEEKAAVNGKESETEENETAASSNQNNGTGKGQGSTDPVKSDPVKSGRKSAEEELPEAPTGIITVRTEGMEALKEGDTLYYKQPVTLEYAADHAGTYTVSYRRDGRLVEEKTSLAEPFLVTLEDGGEGGQMHPVYDSFAITGTDEKGNEIVLSEGPDHKIVIDTRGPEVKAEISTEGDPAYFIVPAGKEAVCTIEADDKNGAGTDPDGYFYYVSDEVESADSLAKLPEQMWTKIGQGEGSVSFTLQQMSGEIYVRVRDRLGNTTRQHAGALVRENQAPMIDVKIKDPGQREICTCSSDEAQVERADNGTEYYGSLQAEVSVTETPERNGSGGYSGIREVMWALVPDGTDAAEAEKGRLSLQENKRPADRAELYGEDSYRSCEAVISPGELVKKLLQKEKGYEKSGPYDLYIWAVDFCGNGEESPLKIPLLLDVTAPAVTVTMEGGVYSGGKYYYRADNDEDVSNDDKTAAVEIRALEDREKGKVRSFSAALQGTVTQQAIKKEASGPDRDRIEFTVGELKRHFGATEQEITITISAADEAGNSTDRIVQQGTRGVRTEEDESGSVTRATFIRDAAAPVVTISYASAADRELHLYADGDNGEEAGDRSFTAYTTGEVQVRFLAEDAFAGDDGIYWNLSGAREAEGTLLCGREKMLSLSVQEGEEEHFSCSARGSDLAGNPVLVRECFAQKSGAAVHPASLELKEVYESPGCREKGDHVPVLTLMIDRKAPEITLVYTPDTDQNPERAVFVYDDRTEEGNVLTAYSSGTVRVRACLQDPAQNADPARLFYKNPGEKAVSWAGSGGSGSRSEDGIAAENDTAAEDAGAGGGSSRDSAGRELSVELAQAESDGEYLYRVYGTDRAGNPAIVRECFSQGAKLEKRFQGKKDLSGSGRSREDSYVPYYAIVIDTRAPAVTQIRTMKLRTGADGELREAGEAAPAYYEDDRTFYYNAEGIKTVLTIEEKNSDRERITAAWELDGHTAQGVIAAEEDRVSFCLCEEGKYTGIRLSGTDRAGNHLVLRGDSPAASPAGKASQNTAETVKARGSRGKDQWGMEDTQVRLTFSRIIDRQSPVLKIMHFVPDDTTAFLYDEKEKDSEEAMYCRRAVTTEITLSDTRGSGARACAVLPDGGKVQVKKLFHEAGNPFVSSAAGSWKRNPSETLSLYIKGKTREEGHYAFSVRGTDRAGNAVIMREGIAADQARGAVLDNRKEGDSVQKPAVKKVPAKGFLSSFYTIVYDKTPPTYRLTIRQPLRLEEAFDAKTGIVYYGRSVSAVQAQYKVRDSHFDETRILAGIAASLSADQDRIERLYPAWTQTDIKGRCRKKDGITEAVFSLQVAADAQHEGVYRFEIEGCDKAGNVLVPCPEQIKADKSAARGDLAAKTDAYSASKGRYWTRRKAIDVTAPTGVLKVGQSPDAGDFYYEHAFEPGGNMTMNYEPFRREKEACAVIASEDCSPTCISFCLRSLDSAGDTAYQKKNPVTGIGDNLWKNDNRLQVTVQGEQVFYLEKILIRDRAGNVRANDPESAFTLSESGRIYLDVTAPAVSGITDTESPRVRICADKSVTRRSADGERYIYRPAGSALELKVSVTDPGGAAKSSGLGEVTVQVKADGKDVTDRIGLQKIPYDRKKGSDTEGEPLVYEIKDALIRIPAGSFAESNDITVTVTAKDNSGNSSLPSRDGGLLQLGIDTTAPRVEVSYTDTVKPRHGKYFRAPRRAQIVVIDRNVDGKKIVIDTQASVPDVFTALPESSAEKGKDGGSAVGSGNNDKWGKEILYEKDGEYTLKISGTDALGNKISDIRWTGPAPQAFTVDTTRPLLRILLPQEVNERDGVRYYDGAVTARIEIRERNFFEETDRNLLDVRTVTGGRCGEDAPAVPVRTPFTDAGGDLHTASVKCGADGDYEIAASYTDLAGNKALAKDAAAAGEDSAAEDTALTGDEPAAGETDKKRRGSTVRSGRFVVDTRAPELFMDPETFRVDSSTGKPLEGLEKQIYTDSKFAPCMIIRDVNYDDSASDLDIKAYGARNDMKDRIAGDRNEEAGEYRIRFRNFERVRELDGVYKVRAEAVDLAKHRSTLEFMFSVNRFGSSYIYADEQTEQMVEKHYINRTEDPVRILELSPVRLMTHKAELFKDHKRVLLKEGEQYSFGAVRGSGKAGTSAEGHRIYEYRISPWVFEEEGIYDFILSSTDIAGGKNTTAICTEEGPAAAFPDETHAAPASGEGQAVILTEEGAAAEDKGEEKAEREIAQSKFSIEFQVDKSVPVNRITGLQAGKERFHADRLSFRVFPEDYQTEVSQVKILVWKGRKDGTGTVQEKEKTVCYRLIGKEEDRQKLAQERIYPLEEVENGIEVTLEESGSWQFLEVITTDLAGNTSRDLRSADPERNLADTRRRFLVTTNPLVRLSGSGRVLGGGAVVLIVSAVIVLKRLYFCDKTGQ